MNTLLRRYRPRTMKEAFIWAEILAQQSPHVYAVVRKFGEYPITKLKFQDTGSAEKKRHKELYEDHLRVRAHLGQASFDSWTYGNSFTSLYEPFKRMLVCSRRSCEVETDINAVEDYTFNLDKLSFKYECPSCHQSTSGQVHDIPLPDPRRLNLIQWDPKNIDIKHNPLTNQSVYYHSIAQRICEDTRAGDQHLVNTMPMGMLRAIRARKLLKFGEGNLYHMKQPGPTGLQSEWGLPPVIAAIEMFLFAAALRKGNEAIAMEHINPFRVLFPQTQTANGDPIMNLDLGEFTQRIERAYKDFRHDPLKILVSPTPVGYQDIGGQGRAMMVFGEVEAAEKNIMLAFGVPREFVEGGLGALRGESTLRMIENQLQNHINNLNGLLRWVELKTSTFLGSEPIDVRLSDFKMIDDVERKQLLLQLWSQQKVSDTTIFEYFEIDADQERGQRKQDTINDIRNQLELDAEIKAIQNSLGQQAISQSQQAKGPVDYNNQDQVIAMADQKVQELMSMDEGSRHSRMDALQSESFVMYSAVKERMEQAKQNQQQEAKAQAAQGGGQ